MKTRFCLILMALFFCTSALANEIREFTSSDGKTKIQASILEVKEDKVRLHRIDGQEFFAPISIFSIDDGIYIKKWQEDNKGKIPPHLVDVKPRIDLKVSSGKTRRRDDQIAGYIDEKKQELAFEVDVENRDQVYPIDTVNVTLWVHGVSPVTGKSTIVYKTVFKDIKLPLNQVRTLTADPFELWYDDEGAMYGFIYKGFYVVVQAPDGKILAEDTTPQSAERFMEAILKLKSGDTYSRSYEKTGNEALGRAVKMIRR